MPELHGLPQLRIDFVEVIRLDENLARLAARRAGPETSPSASIMSTSRAARLKPIRRRRCRYEIDAWPLDTTIRAASS